MTAVLPNRDGPVVANWAEESAVAADRGNLRTVTAEIEENGKKFQVTTSYRITTKKVPRAVAARKEWAKFGAAQNDGPGPNVSTTFAAEPVQLQFTLSQPEQELADDKKMDAMKSGGEASAGRCRFCKVDGHWSHSCPYRDVYKDQAELNDTPRNMPTTTPGAYVPPNQRGERATGLTERRNDECTCRVTNLPEDMPDLEESLRDMFGQIGRIDRFYLARDKNTNRLRGFAFITYENRSNAERAINTFNNAKFGHLILKVEWTKPSNN
ncbi:Eukaryotic translation initiation factor 3 subunit G [Aphelenchoides fujianensis]|nr:Eukaryotic translation initiation factor 3 subunit G [Aphelenchoides fujianensis]